MKTVIQNRLLKKYLPIRPLKELLRRTVATTLKIENFSFPALVSIVLVESDEIRGINHEFRDNDSVTDVLSFPMLEMEDGEFLAKPGVMDMEQGKLFLGDIIICVPKALEQAEEYGHTAERELAFLAVHGLLHLLGYDHDGPERERKMTGKQEKILTELGLPRG